MCSFYAILSIRQSGNPGKLSNAQNCHKRLPKCPKCPQLPPKLLKCKIPQNYQNQCSKGGKMGHWNFLCLNVKGSHLNLHGLVFRHCKSSVFGGNTPARKGLCCRSHSSRGEKLSAQLHFLLLKHSSSAADVFVQYGHIGVGCAFPLTV